MGRIMLRILLSLQSIAHHGIDCLLTWKWEGVRVVCGHTANGQPSRRMHFFTYFYCAFERVLWPFCCMHARDDRNADKKKRMRSKIFQRILFFFSEWKKATNLLARCERQTNILRLCCVLCVRLRCESMIVLSFIKLTHTWNERAVN